MEEPAEEKSEGEGGGTEDCDGVSDLAGEFLSECSNVSRGIAEVGEHDGDCMLDASCWSGVRIVEGSGGGRELASGFGDGAGMEAKFLGDGGKLVLQEGLANGLGNFGGYRIGVDTSLDLVGEVEETIFDLPVGLDDILVKLFESLALHGDEGRSLADEEGQEAHGFGDEEHVVIGAEVAKVSNIAEEMLAEVQREQPGDVIEDGFGGFAHTVLVR